MKKYNCIIIEDEHLLAGVLEDYIRQVPFLAHVSTFGDALQALEYIHLHPVDLIFLDINLPKLKGMDFIQLVKTNTAFIITTAYHEYALQGYELNVLDYLLKPIEFNRFLNAVNKMHHLHFGGPASSKDSGKDYLFVNVNKRRVKVRYEDIVYIEGMKEYVQIYLAHQEPVITKLQLSQIHDLLNHTFIRIHKSYIISKSKVTSYNLTEVHLGTILLPVGDHYKDTLVKELE
jgi:DNA-binding LytR/AlgR family response regulator